MGSPSRATRCATTSRTLDGRSRFVQIRRQYPAAGAVLRERAGLGEVDDHLEQEERVAAGLAAQRLDQGDAIVGHLMPCRVGEQIENIGVIEAEQSDTLDTGLAAQFGQRAGERMGAGQVTLAEGAHHQHRHRLPRRDQVAQHLQAGGVDPVQVVEHQHDRCVRGGEREQAGIAFEEQEALGVRVAARLRHREGEPPGEVRHQAGERESVGVDELPQQCLVGVLDQLRQRLAPRLVGHAEALFAVAVQHVRTGGVNRARGLGDQRGLADAGLAGDQRDAQVPLGDGRLLRFTQPGELGVAAEEGERAALGGADQAGG